MPTIDQIKEANRNLDNLSEEERKQVEKVQAERRKYSQVSILKLHTHGNLLASLIDLHTDQSRQYITMMGDVGVGKLTDEQENEILNYINASSEAKVSDIGSMLGFLTQDQFDVLAKNPQELTTAAAVLAMKDTKDELPM